MEGWDPYAELGVDVNASVGEVKAAFREKARQCHPDKVRGGSPDDGDAFRRARRAYELLTEPEARARYDAGMMVDERRAATVVEVDLDDMDFEDATETYSHACRCSGSYIITGDQLAQGYDTICCSNCSLYIRVLYEAADDALHAQDPPRPGGS